MKTLFTAAALILSVTTANAASDLLAGGSLFDSNEYATLCSFINLGTANVTPTSQELIGIDSVSSCRNGSPVAPNHGCVIHDKNPLTTQYVVCKVTFSGPATDVRGSLQLYDKNSNSLATVELR